MMLRRGIWQPVAEITVIGAWAAWLGRSYLDMNPYTWPVGGEWGTQLQTHHLWTQLQRCGLCALWNGGINGGAPAFADLFGSMLHPLVMITTLLWGVVVGAKVAVVVALGLTGIAQWWIARVLRVELIARLWSSLLAVAGGHLAGRLENGNFGLVLSTAACSLALAAAFNLGITRERHATLALAVMGASALLAGQGYLQLALLGWSPAFLVLMIDARWRWSDIWREYLLAIGLALLLAGIFLIPLFHFWPQVAKGSDPTFRAAQPLAFIPLNLVIVEYSSRTQALGMLPFTYLYNLYIGWIPVILAILAVVGIRRHATRGLLFLSSGTFLMFFLASAIPLRWLGHFLPSVANIRHTPLLAGLAVPALLGLAAIEVDHLHSRPQLRWLLSIPLLWSLWAPAVQTQRWLRTTDASSLYSAIANLRTQNLAWVAPPYGELRWTQAGLDLGLKMSPIVWVFTWQNVPMPYLEAVPNSSPPALLRIGQWAGLPLLSLGAAGVEAERTGTLGKVPIYRYPRQHYAAVVTGSRIYPCQAFGRGGDLTVTCANEQAGELIVQEHTWSGWSAWRNGMPVPLKPDAWLRVAAPAGPHTYAFRYRPWDVLVGLGVTILGTLLTLGLWIHSRATRMTAHRSP
jgi:hypothetical protein